MGKLFWVFFWGGVALAGCKAEEETYPPTDPRLGERAYCNSPTAVNYNWDFPGRPDSSVCIFPSDLFAGTYLFTDSIYFAGGQLDSARSGQAYTLSVTRVSRTQMQLSGFCPGGQTIPLTGNRTQFQAVVDTVTLRGALFCRPVDTVSGMLSRSLTDSLNLSVALTVYSDTGVNVHRGTARRQ
jgi:hypothetical protein